MPNQWPGSQKPIDTLHPLFIVCQNDPTHQAAYAILAAAEEYYRAHNTKADPLFRSALHAVRQARSTFRGTVMSLYRRIESTLPPAPLTAEQQEDARRVAAYREDQRINAQLYLAETIAEQEALYRACLDQPERFAFPVELQDTGMDRGTRILTHRHAIYACLLGFLHREGLDGLTREWNAWGQETIERSRKQTEQCSTSYSAAWERGKGYQDYASGEDYYNRAPLDMTPARKPSRTEQRREQRFQKALMDKIESNSKAAKGMRELRARRKALATRSPKA